MDELREALIVEPDDEELLRDYMFTAEFIIESCQSLVTYDKQTGIVRFTHYTIQEFIQRFGTGNLLSSIDIAKTCLTYQDFALSAENNVPEAVFVPSLLKQYKFAKYSGRYWCSHVRGEAERDAVISGKVLATLTSDRKRKDDFPEVLCTVNAKIAARFIWQLCMD